MTRIAPIRAAILSDRPHRARLLIALAAVAAATLARIALFSFAPNLTFATYFPAVLVCSLLAGWQYGLACAAMSAIVAQGLFAGPMAPPITHPASLTALLVFLASSAIILATGDALRRTVRELDDANRLAETLNKELQHRVGNMLTVIQSLAVQTAKGASPETFIASLSGRLQALKKAHELLGRRNLETCTLPELVKEACLPFVAGKNVETRGPPCQLPGVSCVPLVLALHELCTNAVKYGALSNSDGRVEIAWAFCEQPGRVVIEWKEIGGPVVVKPARKGLGSALLRRQAGIAAVDLTFDPSGVCCKLSIDGADPLEEKSVGRSRDPALELR